MIDAINDEGNIFAVAHILAGFLQSRELLMPSMMGVTYLRLLTFWLCESCELVMPSMMGVTYSRSRYFWMG